MSPPHRRGDRRPAASRGAITETNGGLRRIGPSAIPRIAVRFLFAPAFPFLYSFLRSAHPCPFPVFSPRVFPASLRGGGGCRKQTEGARGVKMIRDFPRFPAYPPAFSCYFLHVSIPRTRLFPLFLCLHFMPCHETIKNTFKPKENPWTLSKHWLPNSN